MNIFLPSMNLRYLSPPPFQQLLLLLPRQEREEGDDEEGVEGEPDGADREEGGSVSDEDEARVEWMPYVPVGPTGEKDGKVLWAPVPPREEAVDVDGEKGEDDYCG